MHDCTVAESVGWVVLAAVRLLMFLSLYLVYARDVEPRVIPEGEDGN